MFARFHLFAFDQEFGIMMRYWGQLLSLDDKVAKIHQTPSLGSHISVSCVLTLPSLNGKFDIVNDNKCTLWVVMLDEKSAEPSRPVPRVEIPHARRPPIPSLASENHCRR
jgi:hypothetical protein